MNKPEFASPAFAYQSNTLSQNILHQLESLTLGSKKCSDFETISQNGNKVSVQKTKQISRLRKKQVKGFDSRCSQASIMRKKNKMHKKMLQNRIVQLQKEISSLRRTCERCPNCHPEILCHGMIPNDVQMVRKEQFLKIARELDHKNSSQSIQFQVLDFAQTLASKPQMDDQAWIMIGVMMIAMGSKNMEIDGTINTFKVLNDCVDSVRRQVQKSLPKIDLDFYFLKQQSGNFIQGLDFDPFYSKVQKGGFQLQGIKLENSEMFDLVYDDKVVFSINYDSLLASMAHLKQNCWVSSF